MGFQVMRLFEGEIYRKLIPLGGSLELEEERVGTGIVASSDILRKTRIAGTAPDPTLFPVG